MVDEQRSAPAFVEIKSVVLNFASDFFAGGVASGFTKSAMAPVERWGMQRLSESRQQCFLSFWGRERRADFAELESRQA